MPRGSRTGKTSGMKRLLLLRHAKSSWDDPTLDDFDRPLAARGRADAPRMGRHLRAQGWIPGRVLCSPARRAVETWQAVAPELGEGPEVELDRTIYMAAPSTLLRRIQAVRTPEDSLMLVGHNPGMEELARRLVGDGRRKDVERLETKYPTCALAVFDVDVETWRDVEWTRATLVDFVRPKDLDG